jgi:acylphosphatase
MPDSSVEIEAEGERGMIEQFIKEVTVGPRHAAVSDVAPTFKDYTGQYRSFDIRG